MAENIFGNPSLARPERELRQDRMEPRLFPASRIRPLDSPATEAEEVSRAGLDERVSASSPTISAPDRCTPASAEPSAGTFLSLGLVGLVATAIIGAFFSIGLLLLSSPAKHTIAASEPISAHPPAPMPPAPATAVPSVAPVPAAPKESPPPQSKAIQAAPPPAPSSRPSSQAAVPPPKPPQSKSVQAASPPAPSNPPSPQAAVPPPKPASVAAVSPVAAHDTAASPSPSPLQKAAAYHAAAHPPQRHLQPEHTRAASRARAAHLRSARESGSPAPRQSHIARSLTPPPDQTRSFDQLVSQLTGQTKPADQDLPTRQARPTGELPGQTLTPPPPDQPDPFTGR